MKEETRWEVGLGVAFIGVSMLLYFLHYLIFRDAKHILSYVLIDTAFVFLEVFLITIVVHKLLSLKEREAQKKKLSMIVGAFFSEVGTGLLKQCAAIDKGKESLSHALAVTQEWQPKDFIETARQMEQRKPEIPAEADLQAVKDLLASRRDFLVNLLANPALHEYERFSNLLWAVFHLTDELQHRQHIHALTPRDHEHLVGDVSRAYGLLISEWLAYLNHLKKHYPYLFSLALRTNPFDPHASLEIK